MAMTSKTAEFLRVTKGAHHVGSFPEGPNEEIRRQTKIDEVVELIARENSRESERYSLEAKRKETEGVGRKAKESVRRPMKRH